MLPFFYFVATMDIGQLSDVIRNLIYYDCDLWPALTVVDAMTVTMLKALLTVALLVYQAVVVVSAQQQQIISTARRWSVSVPLFTHFPPTEGTTVLDPEAHFFVAQTLKYHANSNTGNGTLTAVNISTGAVLWQVYDGSEQQSVYRSGLTLSDHFVHFWTFVSSTSLSLLYALHRANGTVAWKVTGLAASSLASDPYAADGVIYVAATGALYAFDAATGSALPTTVLPGYGSGRPLVIGDIVLVPEETQVQAFTLGTNDTVYNASQTPAFTNGTNYLDAHLLASADRSVVWSWGITSSSTSGRYLTNFDAATGASLNSGPPRLVAPAELLAATTSLAYLAHSYGPVYAARADLSTAWSFDASALGTTTTPRTAKPLLMICSSSTGCWCVSCRVQVETTGNRRPRGSWQGSTSTPETSRGSSRSTKATSGGPSMPCVFTSSVATTSTP